MFTLAIPDSALRFSRFTFRLWVTRIVAITRIDCRVAASDLLQIQELPFGSYAVDIADGAAKSIPVDGDQFQFPGREPTERFTRSIGPGLLFFLRGIDAVQAHVDRFPLTDQPQRIAVHHGIQSAVPLFGAERRNQAHPPASRQQQPDQQRESEFAAVPARAGHTQRYPLSQRWTAMLAKYPIAMAGVHFKCATKV